MSRKNWTSEKIFTRLLSNKTQKTFWENVIELRKRPNKAVYNQAFKLANSEIEKEKIIGIYVLAQLGFDPRFQQNKTVDLYFKLLEKEKDYRQRYKLAGKNLMDTFNMKQDDVNISGIEYLDHTQNVLIVMNHDSNIDPFMVMGATSTIIQGRFVSDADSRGVSKTNDKYFESLHVLYMDRNNLKRAYSDSKHIIEALKSDNVFIFPQGKVNLNGVVKTGTFKMAKNANVGILPLKISIVSTDNFDVLYGDFFNFIFVIGPSLK
jgi:hypothetical protein